MLISPVLSDFVTNSYGESWDSSCEKINHEYQSRTIESQLKKKKSPKLKMLGPLCNQSQLI